MPTYPGLIPFVVYGHDHAFRDEVVGYLRDELGMKPIDLDGVAKAGSTVIERFEEESAKCNLAIVLLTPDDEAKTSKGITYRTARPNVWIELGFFYASFGRKSGRTILIYKKELDIPTDLSGIFYIDATAGIRDADVAMRLTTELNAIVNAAPSPTPPGPAAAGTDYRITGTVRLTSP